MHLIDGLQKNVMKTCCVHYAVVHKCELCVMCVRDVRDVRAFMCREPIN